ncbi:MAG: hypothetical protein GF404_00595 [candidate division Zixibacteria bacterium]|jgi:hypothetical protein|nr:hypothetical protein [candidate division Zixibacteria bacterium]
MHEKLNSNNNEPFLLYKSYSRIYTNFLCEVLKSAGIPYQCRLRGGLMGRGGTMTGIFSHASEDAFIYVPDEYREEAQQIKKQVVGEKEEDS